MLIYSMLKSECLVDWGKLTNLQESLGCRLFWGFNFKAACPAYGESQQETSICARRIGD